MAYDKTKLFEQAQKLIKDNRLFFAEDIIALLPCSKPTFYEHFPPESNELNTLKENLERNRVEVKSTMRKKWLDSDNATLQVALMKLICTDEEAARLNGSNQKVDVTTKGEKLDRNPTIVISVKGIPKSMLDENQ